MEIRSKRQLTGLNTTDTTGTLSAFMVQILPFLTYSKVARGKKEINEIEVRVTGTEARTRIP